jgi:hypothetical protein
MSLKEHRLNVFESEIIADLRQRAENILSCVKFPIPQFSLGHSKKPKVTRTQVSRIRWMRRAYEAFGIEFFLDHAMIMTF